MMKWNRYLKIIPLAVAALLFLNNPAMAEKVTSYNHLYAMLVTEGASQKDEIRDIIEEAQKQAIINQKRFKKVTFGNPLEVQFLNSYYISISFQATLFTTSLPQEAIFTLLFVRKGSDNLMYQDEYLLWIGRKDLAAYSKLDKKGMCQHFQELTGKDVCVEAIQTAKSAAPSVPRHSHRMTDIHLGIIKDANIDQSIARTNWVQSELRGKADVGHTHKEFSTLNKAGKSAGNAEVASLQVQVAQLEQTVAQLKSLLNGVSRKGNDITFKSVNVHIVNGTGKTDGPVNGLGNLIVGYNEANDRGAPIPRKGSHNVVVGSKNGYASYGGLVVGLSNTASGRYSSVSGGSGNIAKGDSSTVSGGHLNVSKGNFSSVSGGLNRTASENNSWRGGEQSSTQ